MNAINIFVLSEWFNIGLNNKNIFKSMNKIINDNSEKLNY
jgi:hypothetical protein